MDTIVDQIARELGVERQQVEAAVQLLAEGATVPFIARYRKEVTGGLSDVQLRQIEERIWYLSELEERRAAVLKSLDEQGKLTADVRARIEAAATKARLEDLYLPYRPRRRSRASEARAAGLDRLAATLVKTPGADPQQEAAAYVDAAKGVGDPAAALEGARWVLIDRCVEDPDLLERLREYAWERAFLHSRVAPGKEEKGAKFADYFKSSEPIRAIPSHRALAMLRGRKEGILRLRVSFDAQDTAGSAPEAGDASSADGVPSEVPATGTLSPPEQMIAEHIGAVVNGGAASLWVKETIRRAWKTRVFPHLQVEIERQLREQAERDAIRVFSRNLRDLLLAAPAGAQVVMGLDPGLRTGVKVAVVDGAGTLRDTATMFPHQPRNEWEPALAQLAELARRHAVTLVAIGNGTASRETDRLVAELIKRHPDLGLHKVIVSEAGASAYSASRLGARELPDIDATLRGAVSIARRLQDPLAELVKIEPRAIGVGQYQHDVNQARLNRALGGVVEDCVNAVGVDLNAASVSLLSRVAGFNRRLADAVVAFRSSVGPFQDRQDLRRVAGVSERTFQQAAGFVRITGGVNPLDASRVHPESYPVVERICQATGTTLRELIGRTDVLAALAPEQFVDERVGVPTVRDILAELEQPGRDPRPAFKMPEFKQGIDEIEHLQPGMLLEGVVTNVASFGAFVDIGVHQDGLVHVSRLADRFVKDPREIVKAGDIVKVKVVEVDLKRRRIALSMRFEDSRPATRDLTPRPPMPKGGTTPVAHRPGHRRPVPGEGRPKGVVSETAMSAAFARLLKRL